MLRSLIAERPLGSFVVINYLISWSFLYPCYQAILNAEEGTFPRLALIGLVGAFGPTLAAIIIEGVQNGKQGVKALLRKAVIWRVSWYWYLFVLLVPMALYGAAVWSSGCSASSLVLQICKTGSVRSFLSSFLLCRSVPWERSWAGVDSCCPGCYRNVICGGAASWWDWSGRFGISPHSPFPVQRYLRCSK